MKIAYFDIEAHDLAPVFAPLLCAAVLDVTTGQMITLRQDKYVKDGKAECMVDDEAILKDLKELLDGYHMHCGWYSKGYDIPLINTRLAKYGHRILDSRWHIDGIWYFKGWRGLKPKSAKLKHASELFGYEPKPEVEPETWLLARGGDKRAVDEVVDRCAADVRITRDVIERAIDIGLVKNITRYP